MLLARIHRARRPAYRLKLVLSLREAVGIGEVFELQLLRGLTTLSPVQLEITSRREEVIPTSVRQ